jgi:hypothetical protein
MISVKDILVYKKNDKFGFYSDLAWCTYVNMLIPWLSKHGIRIHHWFLCESLCECRRIIE